MNKMQLAEAIAVTADISKLDARKAVDAFIKTVTTTLAEGEKVCLTGFGSFVVMHSSARIGRNPRTGAAVKIASRRVVKFRPTLEID